MQIDDLLRLMTREEASDLHLKPMRPPMLRIKGRLQPIEGDTVSPAEIKEMLTRLMTDRQRAHLEEKLYVDFGYSVNGVARFRAAVFHQRGTLAAVFRRVPFKFPSLDDWGLPEVIKDFAVLPQGLVLVTGPSGSGKSSTLAAMIREILDKRLVHVVTIEDPIEFLLTDDYGTVSQREVGTDTHSYDEALHNALRQDPDVIMVGEMRDPKTIATVLTAAETGHLVISTIHANSGTQTIDRIVDAFPEGQHRQIRLQLAQVLEATVSLQLVERSDGSGLVAAVEIMRRNPKISKLIVEGKPSEIEEEIQKSVSFERMQTLNQSLVALVLNGVVSREAAVEASPTPAELTLELRQYLYGDERPPEGDHMADSTADFSKILELREIRRLYDESQERYRMEMADKDAYIERLKADIAKQDTLQDTSAITGSLQSIKDERDKLQQQIAFQKQEYEAKIEKLQHRVRELTAPQPDPARTGGGLFRR